MPNTIVKTIGLFIAVVASLFLIEKYNSLEFGDSLDWKIFTLGNNCTTLIIGDSHTASAVNTRGAVLTSTALKKIIGQSGSINTE